MKYYISLTLLSFLAFTYQNEYDINGTYINVHDPGLSFQISERFIQFIDKNVNPDVSKEAFYFDHSGKLAEAPLCDSIHYKIDSIDINGGFFISGFNGSYRCFGYHLIKNSDYLSVTPLKFGDGINYHFMIPALYKKRNGNKPIELSDFTIEIPDSIALDRLHYLAFGQPGMNKAAENARVIINNVAVKSEIQINPIWYAAHKYRSFLINQQGLRIKEIPVLYHSEYDSIKRTLSKEERYQALIKKGILDLYLVVYRFNPGRQRVVNEIFGEEIQGQVQPFELKSLKKDYRNNR